MYLDNICKTLCLSTTAGYDTGQLNVKYILMVTVHAKWFNQNN